MFIFIFLITIGSIAFLSYREWTKHLKLTPKELQQTYLHITKLISMEEWEEARNALDPFLAKEPLCKEVLLLHIQILRGMKEHEKALELACDAAREEPEELLFRIEEGKTLLEMGHAHDALKCYQIAEPILRNESDLLDYARANLKADCLERAWQIVEPLLLHAPQGTTLAIGGDIALEKGEFARAISLYLEAIKKGCHTHQIHTQLGHAHRLSGNFKEAEKIYRKILEKDSSDVAATIGLGACMEERGTLQKALLFYQAAKAWEKRDPRLLVRAGTCAFALHKYEEAEEYFEEVIETCGLTSDLLVTYGLTLERQKKWRKAEDIYKELVIQFPEDPRGYQALAWMFGVGLTTTLSGQEGLQVAKAALDKAQGLDSYEILSAVQARMGLFEEAFRIQEYLTTFDKEKTEKIRRSQLIKLLSKQLPFQAEHLARQTH